MIPIIFISLMNQGARLSTFLSAAITLTREVSLKGKAQYSTVDLLVLTSLDQLLFILKIFLPFY